jgi:hypothetical protein
LQPIALQKERRSTLAIGYTIDLRDWDKPGICSFF